ncbi:MAG: rod shape-determining protein RodA, partial [Bacteroidetes bacterium]|nr:rod shape-determining protein RodA [Bacteroidota bacterium]
SFINPSADPLGAGYNAIQAKVAIGSGGFLGKGFLAGSQTQLQFIPEQWTDFIYCVIGEEFGFIGTMITLGLFLYLFIRILRLASSAKDEFLSLTLIGILAIYFIHFIINVGMVVGIMPVIGLPLPFVSYGGSSLLLNMIMLGIAANVYRTRKNYA